MSFGGFVRADTSTKVKIGPFVDVSDGFTPQTDIDISASNEAELIKHDSSVVVDISGSGWAAITSCRGYYSLSLTAGNTDTEGIIDIVVQDDSDCLPVEKSFQVVNAPVFDSLFKAATTDYLPVDLIQMGGVSQSGTDLKDLADTGYNPTDHKIQADVIAFHGSTFTESSAGNIAANFETFYDNGDSATSASVISEIAQILTDTAEIGAAGAGLTNINLPNQTMDITGNITGNLSGSVGSVSGAVGSVTGHTVQTGDSYSRIGATGSGLTSLAQASVCTETRLAELDSANLPADIAAVAAYIDTEIAAIKAVTDDMKMKDTTISGDITADTKFALTSGLTANDDPNNAVCSIYDTTGSVWSGPRRITDYVHASKLVTIDENTPFPLAVGDKVIIWNVSYTTTAAAASISQSDINSIADAVFDEAQADHLTAGTTGAKLNAADRTER